MDNNSQICINAEDAGGDPYLQNIDKQKFELNERFQDELAQAHSKFFKVDPATDQEKYADMPLQIEEKKEIFATLDMSGIQLEEKQDASIN